MEHHLLVKIAVTLIYPVVFHGTPSMFSDHRDQYMHPLDGQSSSAGRCSSGFYFTQIVDGLALMRCLWTFQGRQFKGAGNDGWHCNFHHHHHQHHRHRHARRRRHRHRHRHVIVIVVIIIIIMIRVIIMIILMIY